MATLFEPAPQSPDARDARDSPERKRRKPEPRLSVIRLSLKKGILDPELLRHTPNLAHQVKADPRKKPGGLAKELEKLYPFASLHTEGAEGPQDDLVAHREKLRALQERGLKDAFWGAQK